MLLQLDAIRRVELSAGGRGTLSFECNRLRQLTSGLPVTRPVEVQNFDKGRASQRRAGQRHFFNSESQLSTTLIGSGACAWSGEFTRKRFPSAATSNGSHAVPIRFW